MKMTSFILGVCASALSIGCAVAADLPSYKSAPAAPPPAFTWTGWHIGVNGGWGGGTVESQANIQFLGFGAVNVQRSFSTSGFVVGGQHGYMWQLPNNVVVGYESDYQYADVSGRDTAFGTSGQRLEWFGTERLRFGYAFGRFLPYFTGGLVYGRISANGAGLAGGFWFPVSGSSTHAGWTVGAGLEYALWGNLSVKAEYLYAEMQGAYGSTLGVPLAGGFPAVMTYRTPAFGTHIARAGLNYKVDIGGLLGIPGL